MKAWIAKGVTGLGAGLGKKDVLVVPRPNGNSLAVDLASGGRIWIEDDELTGQPCPDDPLEEVEISEKLVEEVNFSYDVKKGNLTQHAKNLLTEFITSVKN